MPAKKVIFSDDARHKIAAGISILAKAVKMTLGPKGRNVILEKSYGAPTVTRDGVSVAKEITLKDKFENMGAQMLKEVASKTSDVVGDGTTTATVLAEAIFREGMKSVAAGANPMDIKRGIDKAVLAVVDELKNIMAVVRRYRYIIHVQGTKWVGDAAAAGGPTDAELATAANWEKVYETKNIGIVQVLSNG